MEPEPMWGQIAAAFCLVGYISYFISMRRCKKIRPERNSWIIWTALGVTSGLSYWQVGAEATLWVAIMDAVCPFVILMFILKNGREKWSKGDIAQLLVTCAALIWLAVTNSPAVALVICLAVDWAGALPTIRKTTTDRRSESLLSWSVTTLGYTLNLFAIDKWNWEIVIYPFSDFLMCGVMTYLLLPNFRTRRPLP